MDRKSKLKHAAIAAVLYYLKADEEQVVREPLVQASYPSPWALNGRQTTMQMRALIQRRVLKR